MISFNGTFLLTQNKLHSVLLSSSDEGSNEKFTNKEYEEQSVKYEYTAESKALVVWYNVLSIIMIRMK